MPSTPENPFRRRPKTQAQEGSGEPAAPEAETARDHERFEAGPAPHEPEPVDDWGDGRTGAPSEDPASDRATDQGGKRPLKRQPKGPIGVQKGRPGQGLRRLPSEMQDLADGKVDRLRRAPKRRDPVEDERVEHRSRIEVAHAREQKPDARVSQLRAAIASGDDATLGDGLCDALRLALYRARNVTDFDAFAENVVGVSAERARKLVDEAAARHAISLDALPMHVAALWLRAEASLLRDCAEGRITVRGAGAALRLQIDVPAGDVNRAAIALFDLGGAANGLRPFLREEPTARDAAQRDARELGDEGTREPRAERDADRFDEPARAPERERDDRGPSDGPRREGGGGRFGGPRREGGGGRFGGPRREGGGGRFDGPRREGGGRFDGPRREGGGGFGGPKRGGTFDGPKRGGTFDGPKRGGTFDGPKRGGTFDGPKRGGTFDGPKRGGTFGGPKRGGTFDGPKRGGTFDGPKRGGTFGGPKRGGGFGGPKRGGFGGPKRGGSSGPTRGREQDSARRDDDPRRGPRKPRRG